MRPVKNRVINKEEAVTLRIHRRSLEQKSRRINTFCQGRPGLNPSLDSVAEEPIPAENVPAVAPGTSDARREILKRWKAKKELQRKLEKKPFKITKIDYSQPIFLFSEKDLNGDLFRPNNASTRVTRSMAKVNSTKGVAVNAREPVKTATKPAVRGPAAKHARAGLQPSKLPVATRHVRNQIPKAAKATTNHRSQPSATATSSSSYEEPSVPRPHRETRASFAPEQFSFKAPIGVSPFAVGLNASYIDRVLPSFFESPPEKVNSEESALGNPKICTVTAPLPNEEADFKTPASATNGNAKGFKISPLLMNNPWICTSRGRPSSANKKHGKSLIPEISNDHAAMASPKEDEKKMVGEDEIITRSSTGVALTTGYFRDLLENQTEQLKSMCQTWNSVMETEKANLSENVAGRIRVTIGLAELLMAERFKQFSGLIDDCVQGRGEKVTTCVDLQGFWEMIYTQVEDVNKKFESLKRIQNNSWTEIETPIKKPAAALKKRAKVTKVKINPEKSSSYQASRQRLAEAKAKAKAIRQQEINACSPEVQISMNDDGRVLRSRQSNTQASELGAEVAATPKQDSPGKIRKSTSERRMSLRRSILTENLDKTLNSPALLVPLPVLEKLSLSSPVEVQNPSMRLSELYSPLAAGRKRVVPTLETIQDEDIAMLMDEGSPDVSKTTPTPKRTTRRSNLIRFSEVSYNFPVDSKISEKENIDIMI